MLITAEQILSKLYGLSHFMECNLQDCTFDEDDTDEDSDPENPGFVKGWIHFLDVTTNSVISFSEEEMKIEISIGDQTNAVLKTEERIAHFLELQNAKSQQFKNTMGLSLKHRL